MTAHDRPSQTVFLSYARDDDEEFVRRLRADLENGEIAVWWDRECMESRGWTFLHEIRDAIEGADRLIAVIGPEAVTSEYVKYEWDHARLYCRGVVPVLRLGGDEVIPDELEGLDYIDFRDDRGYERALEALVRKLTAPMKEPGDTAGVPTLPKHYLPRPHYLKRLRETVLADITRPTTVTCANQVTVLHGMGGAGKSVLAAAFATQTDTRRAFSEDGIIWLQSSPDEQVQRANLERIGKHCGDDGASYATRADAILRLPKVLRDKSLLVVLDDVREVRSVTPYRDCISFAPRCRLLVTARTRLSELEAESVAVDELETEAARRLLALWSGVETERLPAAAEAVAEQCGNLPLALALCGAMVAKGSSWPQLLERLAEADLEFITARLEHLPKGWDLLRAMQVSEEALRPHEVQHYREFAVFPEHTADPEAAVVTLWLHTDGLKAEPYAHRLLTELAERAMLELEGANPRRRVSLHPLQHDYVRAVVGEEAEQRLHGDLVDAYRGKCGDDGWCTGPDDGYFFQRLAYHMHHAGLSDEMEALLLDYRWLRARLDTPQDTCAAYWDVVVDYERLAGDGSLVVDRVAASGQGSERDKACILRELGTIYEELGRRTTAERALVAAETSARSLGDELLLASVLTELGKTRFHLGQFEESQRNHADAFRLYEPHRDELSGADLVRYGWCLEWTGEQHRNVFEMEDALRLHEEACRVADRAAGVQPAAEQLRAHATGNIGAVHYWQGDLDETHRRWKEALQISTRAGDKPRVAHYTIDVGFVCFLRRDYAEALRRLDDGIALAREVHAHENEVRGLMNKASVLFAQGSAGEAEDLYQEAMRISKEEDVPRLTWRIQHNLGNVYLSGGDSDRAAEQYRAAVESVEVLMMTYDSEDERRGFVTHRLNPFRAMIRLCLQRGDRDGARSYARRGLDPSLPEYLERRVQGIDLEQEEEGNARYIDGYYVETE